MVHINLHRQMPNNICNKEITINREKNIYAGVGVLARVTCMYICV